MSEFFKQLAGGDRRSIGKANDLVEEILAAPERFAEVMAGLSQEDPVIRMRCADVAEKVSKAHPDWLQPHKRAILTIVTRATEKEIRWHLAQMLPRLTLTAKERQRASEIMFEYLTDESRIVQTFAMQALADFAQTDAALHRRLWPLLLKASRTGTGAVRARARLLLARVTEAK
jgi:hypothetical protein